MCIKSWRTIVVALLMAAVLTSFLSPRSMAATIETEDDDSDVAAPPTPGSQGSNDLGGTGVTGLETAVAKARIDDLVGFYYLVQSGFVTRDPSQLASLGKVSGSFDEAINFSDPLKMYVDLSGPEVSVKAGDILVVYRATYYMREPHSGFTGYWVQNLAFVKVLEIQGRQCRVQSLKTFSPFKAGDRVKSYDDEIKRWKQAQLKKDLPAHPVRALVVAGADPITRTFWDQKDWIILTAGMKKGVVEGQNFRLFRVINRPEGDPVHSPVGSARVFYAGPDYSMAQIVSNTEPVRTGFEARYEP